MKRFLIAILALFILFTPNIAQGVEFKDENNNFIETIDNSIKLKKEIKEAIIEIYGKEQTEEIFEKVLLQAQKAVNERSKELLAQDYNRKFDWYKNEIIYMFYVDQF